MRAYVCVCVRVCVRACVCEYAFLYFVMCLSQFSLICIYTTGDGREAVFAVFTSKLFKAVPIPSGTPM